MNVTEIIQYVPRKGAVTGTNLVNNEVFIWEVLEQILRNEALGDRLAVPWLAATS